ncbi:MAG: hypothetical protein ACOVQR_02735 [Flavobacterium sp.]|jgi:hypothetical protein|uniref:hypothetical protein n=1 Tax=Flavobacterium sp. TaxID=239 RepID=UPI003BA56798
MRAVIDHFFNHINANPIELYSEFGLQHEMALFIRMTYPNYRVRLEYHVRRINPNLINLVKWELDLFVTEPDGNTSVVEFKMPKSDSGAPAEMYSAIKDVKFLEQLENVVDNRYAVLVTNNVAFWNAPRATSDIYHFFNGDEVNISSLLHQHTPAFLRDKPELILNNTHNAQWQELNDIEGGFWKYYVLRV